MFEHRNPWVKQQFQIDSAIANNALPADNANTETGAIEIGTPVGIEMGANLVGLEIEVFDSTHVAKFRAVITTFTAGSPNTIKVKLLSAKGSHAVQNNDYAHVIGSALGEGTGSPTAWSNDLEVVYNQCQIFKTPVEVTGTLLQASLRGNSKELARLRDMKSQEHKIQKERAFLFGSNMQGITGGTFGDLEATTDVNGNTIRTTMGIVSALNKALSKAQSDSQEKMNSVAGGMMSGLKIPGM